MAQLSDDCFAFGGALLSVDAAAALIASRVGAVDGIETVGLWEADGRVLAAALAAPADLPGFDNAAVDGYAVRHADAADGGVLPVRGRVAAGAPAPALLAGHAMRVFTGAPMPAGADTVFMQEDVTVLPDGRVRLPAGLRPGANRRPRGEDIAAGAPALPAGRRLRPQDIALAAALGLDRLAVRRRLRVAILSTGNEVGACSPAGLHDSNRPLLAALLRRTGAEVIDLGIRPDDRAAIAGALAAAAGADLILSSGGVSTGEEDHVKAALEAAGSLVFWRMAIKPGRPVAMGLVAGTPFVGLPGNPVAVFVTFVHLVRPLLAALGGEVWVPPRPFSVRAGFGYRKKAGRREYVRVRLDGEVAQKHPREGAGILTSLTETEGLAELGETVTQVAVGEVVGFLPYGLLQ